MSMRTRLIVWNLAIGVALISPAAAAGAAHGTDLPLVGTSTAVATIDISTNPSPTSTDGSGVATQLGMFTTTQNDSLTPTSAFVNGSNTYDIGGTERAVAANGDELFGSLTGTGVNSGTSATGTNTVTITGGTGRFADATGVYTETYTDVVVSFVGTVLTGDITTTIHGEISY